MLNRKMFTFWHQEILFPERKSPDIREWHCEVNIMIIEQCLDALSRYLPDDPTDALSWVGPGVEMCLPEIERIIDITDPETVNENRLLQEILLICRTFQHVLEEVNCDLNRRLLRGEEMWTEKI